MGYRQERREMNMSGLRELIISAICDLLAKVIMLLLPNSSHFFA